MIAVPRLADFLINRWELMLQDSRVALSELLERLGKINVFYHDSLHTYDHMKFEFDTAAPYLKEGGLLLSDDILWNNAYHEACAAQGAKPIIYRSFGMMRKV